MNPDEFLAFLMSGSPVVEPRVGAGQIAQPRALGERRPAAQQPHRMYHNIPVVANPDGTLRRDDRMHASAEHDGRSALQQVLARLARLRGRPQYRGADPSTAPRTVQVPR